MNRPLLIFIVLQILDAATTLFAFAMGGTENNPLVGQFLAMGPVTGLLLTKLIVISIAAGAAFLGKHKGLRLANLAFAGVVVWNVSIIGRLAMQAAA
jgi:hypothetical protein